MAYFGVYIMCIDHAVRGKMADDAIFTNNYLTSLLKCHTMVSSYHMGGFKGV